MPEKLGQMLLHGGALTQTQLEEALSAQSIYGGRLGTNLVEMGLLTEDDLARSLQEKLGVPNVDPAALESLPPGLLGILPLEMVERYRVVPVALEGKRLTLAMADPADFSAIDEIGFLTGLVVIPRVCSELRLSMALERYYGIKRKLRFIPVQGGSRTQAERQAREHFGLETQQESSLAEPEREHGVTTADFATGDRGREPGLAAFPGTGADAALSGPGFPEGASRYTPSPEGGGLGRGSLGEASVHEGAQGRMPSGAMAPGSAQEAAAGAARHLGIEELARDFADAAAESEVVAELMCYLRQEFDCSGFLSVRRGVATGIQAVTKAGPWAGFGGCEIGTEVAPLLKHVLQEKSLYMGRLPQGGGEEQIQVRMGGHTGAPVLILPLVIGGTSVAFLMVEDQNGRLGTGLFELQRVAAKAELAFEMIGIRKKIRQV